MNDTKSESPPLSQTDIDTILEEQEEVDEAAVVDSQHTDTPSEGVEVSADSDTAVKGDETEAFDERSPVEMDTLFTQEDGTADSGTPSEDADVSAGSDTAVEGDETEEFNELSAEASDDSEEFSVLSQQDMDDLIMEVDDTSELEDGDGPGPAVDVIAETTEGEQTPDDADAKEPEDRSDAPGGIEPDEETGDGEIFETLETDFEGVSPDPIVVSEISPPALKEIQPGDTEDSSGGDISTDMPGGSDQKIPGKKRTGAIIAACVLTLACVGAWIVLGQGVDGLTRFFSKGAVTGKSVPAETPGPASHDENMPLTEPEPSEQAPVQPPETAAVLPPILEDPVGKAELLRQALSAKQAEINDLQTYYKKGILEMEGRIFHEIQEKHILSHETALQNQNVALALYTIQRRQSYIANLKNISKRIAAAGEQLIYLKRQAIINAMVLPVTDGLDNNLLADQIHRATETHAAWLDNIVFGIEPDRMAPLASIWQRIVSEPEKPHKKTAASLEDTGQNVAHGINSEIAGEICNGNLSRKHLLTELPEETAVCLAKWRGNALMINGLKHLSPEAAAHLSRWRGDWLCLNGITTLSADAAKHLFQWKGQRLSMNGVAHLAPEASGHIPGWTGKHLELVGLTDLPFETASDLVKWQKTGGKIYVAERLQR